jgi:hypothetical protein
MKIKDQLSIFQLSSRYVKHTYQMRRTDDSQLTTDN